ncbi:MAG: hypothetical protein AAFY15_08020 [Cyanobacteria bacterium J06648_11]
MVASLTGGIPKGDRGNTVVQFNDSYSIEGSTDNLDLDRFRDTVRQEVQQTILDEQRPGGTLNRRGR